MGADAKSDAGPCLVTSVVLNFLRQFVRRNTPLRLICAVSGGEDSHALLHVLTALKKDLGLELCVAHFNHGLRVESNHEAKFVERLALSYGLPFVMQQAPARNTDENMEAWARRHRYDFLETVRASEDAQFVVTAHHANDQAETYLFRLLSGRLATEAFSIAERDDERALIRPFLKVRKQAIEDYAARYRLRFVVDASNEDLERTRNRLRHSLIPLLEREYNPRIIPTILEIAGRLEDDERTVWQLAEAYCPRADGPLGQIFLAAPKALQWRALKLLAERQIGAEAGKLGYRVICALVDRIVAQRGEPFVRDLGFGIRARFSASETLEFLTETAKERLLPVSLEVPGAIKRLYADGSCASIQARLLSSDILPPAEAVEQARSAQGSPVAESRAFFDADKVDMDHLMVRERSEGDRLRVWMRGERKLKKLLQEQGVKLTLRDSLPIVEEAGNILWIPGIARSETAPVTESTKHLLELSYLRIDSATGVYRINS